MRAIASILFAVASGFASLAEAAAPQSGLWWNPAESGRGYAIDVQDDTLVMTTFAYGADGRMQWYYSDGKLQGGGAAWSGTLLKLDSGQPLNGAYKAPTVAGNEGTVTIAFTSRTTGNMTLPGGRVIPIERQNFGVGAAPQSILGAWLYVYAVGNDTFAQRFQYTTIGAPTPTGSGIVMDTMLNATAELQVSGEYAGEVVALQFNASHGVIGQFYFYQYLEEGRGFWVQPNTQIVYPMNAYRFAGPARIEKSGGLEILRATGAGSQVGKAVTLEELSARNPALGKIAEAMWRELQKAKN